VADLTADHRYDARPFLSGPQTPLQKATRVFMLEQLRNRHKENRRPFWSVAKETV